MTQGNIAIVRLAYEAFSAGDVERLKRLVSSDFVLRASMATDVAEHYGPKAMDEILQAIHERWDEFRLEPLEFYEDGNCVLVLGTLVTKGRDHTRFASTVGQVWTLENGTIVSMLAFLDSEEAIRASGLTRLLA